MSDSINITSGKSAATHEKSVVVRLHAIKILVLLASMLTTCRYSIFQFTLHAYPKHVAPRVAPVIPIEHAHGRAPNDIDRRQ